jgi:heme/copper-type cytochrome/quinol oxidase subunit 1
MYVTHHFGGDLGSYHTEIAWFWTVPQVYLLAVPVAGVALEIVPVLAKARLRLHAAALVVIGLLGVAGIGAWAQVSSQFTKPLYVAIGLFAVLPALALLGLLADAARGGRPAPKAALVLALGAALLLLVGAVAGALLVIDPLHVHGTVWETGQTNLIVFGAGGLGAMAALWWWGPKLYGAPLNEGLGFLAFLTTFVGALLLGIPDLIVGKANKIPVNKFTFDDGGSAKALGGLGAAGAVLVTVGGLVVVLALLATLRKRGTAAKDPWGGYTLEWATDSPPARANFDGPLPTVMSATPLFTDEVTA